MAARHCQWRCVNTSIPLIRLCKNITESDIFQFFFNLKLRCLLILTPVEKISFPLMSFSFFFKKKWKVKKMLVFIFLSLIRTVKEFITIERDKQLAKRLVLFESFLFLMRLFFQIVCIFFLCLFHVKSFQA
jgi:hypothetical protein